MKLDVLARTGGDAFDCPLPPDGNTEIELREVVDFEQFAGKLAPAFAAQQTVSA